MNSLTITGNLGRDAETRYLTDGNMVASFSVADAQGKDKQSIWWNCALYGKRAESLAQYLTKGQTVTVIGTVSEREWIDKTTGVTKRGMSVRVSDIALQGSKATTKPAATKDQQNFSETEDDIPF